MTAVSGSVAGLSGMSVEMSDINGSMLASNVSAADGTFVLSVPSADIAGGFRLRASGAAFSGALTALYLPTELTGAFSISPTTTLVDDLASSGAVAGADPFSRRDAAVSRLVDVGLAEPGDWHAPDPAAAPNAQTIAAIVRSGSVGAWTASVLADLADGDILPENMGTFPRANGGVLSVNASASAFAGQVLRITPAVSTTGALSEHYHFQLQQAPQGMQISGDGVISFTVTGPAPRQLSFTLLAVQDETQTGRVTQQSIDVLDGEILGSANIGPSGGVVTDPWDTTTLEVPAGAVAGDVLFQIVRARNAEGDAVLSFLTTPSNVQLSKQPVFVLPDPSSPENASKRADKSNGQVLQHHDAWFLTSIMSSGVLVNVNDNRLPTRPQVPGVSYCVSQRASQLVHHCSGSCTGDPVLFVHGFNLYIAGMGGGTGTWGDFFERLSGQGFDVYEMQYITAARFQDAASDLADYVGYLARKTGKRVHLVAHSFGGLVCRTYLQGLAGASTFNVETGAQDSLAYGDDVATLTTLGTPHSGISDSCGSVLGRRLPDGLDNFLAHLSNQLSVYEAGLTAGFSSSDTLGLKNSFRIDAVPGEIPAALADLAAHPLPRVPVQALIGLQEAAPYPGAPLYVLNGDGLISYAGQRFHPSFSTSGQSCVNNAVSGQNIDEVEGNLIPAALEEHLLGLPDGTLPGATVAPGSSSGFSHTGLFSGIPEADLEDACTGNASCAEPYTRVLNWIQNIPAAGADLHTFKIRAQVLRAYDRSAVAGARVTAFRNGGALESNGITDAEGSLLLTVTYAGPGRYTLYVSANGLHSEFFDASLDIDEQSQGTFEFGVVLMQDELGGRGALAGFVTDAVSDDALSGTDIEASNGLRTVRARSDANGHYVISDIAAGSWQVRAEHTGYYGDTWRIAVLPGEVTDGPLALSPLDSGPTSLPTVYTRDPNDYGWAGNACSAVQTYVTDRGGSRVLEMALGWGRQYSGSDWQYIYASSATNLESLLEGLSPGTYYYVQGFARNAAYPDTWAASSEISFYTSSQTNIAELGAPFITYSTSQGFVEYQNYYTLRGIRNLGDRDVSHAVCRLWISVDGDFYTSGDYFVQQYEIYDLPACGVQWVRVDFQMPNLGGGTYKIKFLDELDVDDEVNELNDGNWLSIDWLTAFDADKSATVGKVLPPYHPGPTRERVYQARPQELAGSVGPP